MRITALEYHDVIENGAWDASGFPGPDAATYKLERPLFETHLDAVALTDLAPTRPITDVITGSAPPTPILTFDDGGVSAATVIAPLLAGRGWIGHFLIPTQFIDTPGFVTTQQIQEIRRQGHVIGSHSASHPLRMAACSRRELTDEWTSSIATLSAILSEPVTVASIPGGYYSTAVAEAAAQAGITVLFTSEPTRRVSQVGNCTAVGRYTLRQRSRAAEAAALVRGQVLPAWRQWGMWNVKKVAKTVGGEWYVRARKRILK